MALAFKKFSDVLKGVLTSLSKLTTYTPSSTYTPKYDANGNFLGLISGTNDAAVAAGVLGEELPNGANLNDYKRQGYYRVINSACAQSLVNAPSVGMAFVLVVYGTNTTYPVQIIYSGSGIFTRRYTNSGFLSWKRVVLEDAD